ncbi:MAG: LacI family DNA-binding transcriptional regulator, partial [Chloroflexota bacterium]
MSVTIEDISRKLGISISTISKALNGYTDVSARTRDLVLQTAQEMGYHPNTAARNLRRGRTDKIGIIISESIVYISEYLAEIIPGAALTAEQNDTNLILYTSVDNSIANLTRICRSREVDGMILLWSSEMSSMIDLLELEKMPYIIIGRRSERAGTSYVAPDNFEGAKAITQHLIELGHRRIGFMLRPALGTTNVDRFAGYRAALDNAGLPLIDELVVTTAIEHRSGYHAMNTLLDLLEPPTAVFSFHDVVAVDAMVAVKERGLRVPDDVSITGFDGLRSSLITTPRLTTVRQPLQEIGQRTVSTLLALIEDPSLPPIRERVPVHLEIRESTASPQH